MKTCSCCGQSKPLEAFPARTDRASTTYAACRACKTAWAKTWQRIQKLKRHGVADHLIPAILAEQENGRCHACDRPAAEVGRLHVDHDHATNEYRGLLCKPCNTALGLVEDDIERLCLLAAYLTPDVTSLELMR